MKLFRRPTDGDFEAPRPAALDGRLARALAEREELREAADRLAVALRDAIAERDTAQNALSALPVDVVKLREELAAVIAEREDFRAALDEAREATATVERRRSAAHDALIRTRNDLLVARAELDQARAQVEVLRLGAPSGGDPQLRHALLRSEEVRARQDERLAELASLGCPRPCCTSRVGQ